MNPTPKPSPWRSLRTQIIGWSFVPTAIILFMVALVTYFAYQQVTETLVIERDEEVTRLSGNQLSTRMTLFSDELVALARIDDLRMGNATRQQQALEEFSNRLVIFDGGVILLDQYGLATATYPFRPELQGRDFSVRDYFRRLVSAQKPVYSNVLADGPDDSDVVALAVPIIGERGEFRGAAVGMFRLGPTAVSAFYGSIVKLGIGEDGNIYLVDEDGRVIYHSNTERIGADFSDQAVVQQVTAGQAGAVRTEDADGQRIVAGYAPVPGTPWGLVSEERWANLTAASRGYGQSLLLLLALGVILPVFVVTVGVRRITGPINALIAGAQEVARGNFGQKVAATGGNEIETLSRQFNLMAAQLQESYAQLEQQVADRSQALAALNSIAAVVSRSTNLQEVLQDALERILTAIRIETGGVYLLREADQTLTVAAHAGLNPELVAAIDNLKIGEGFSGKVVATGEPIVVNNVSEDPRLTRSMVRQEGLRALASVPLVSSGKVRGALFVLTRTDYVFSPQDIELLVSIGHLVGVAVENAELISQAQETAAMAERQRLARDLHDAVTQTLFSASLIAEVLPRLYQRNPEEGERRLAELRQLTRGALAEMRTLLMELRPTALVEASLDTLIRQLTEAFTGRTGATVDLALSTQGDCSLPPDVHVTLYRLAQESLNNVIKHANASQLSIHLRCSAQQVDMVIEDDGVGFDPDAVSSSRLGLGIMRERAAAIGATLDVDSEPGQGTAIAISWTRP